MSAELTQPHIWPLRVSDRTPFAHYRSHQWCIHRHKHEDTHTPAARDGEGGGSEVPLGRLFSFSAFSLSASLSLQVRCQEQYKESEVIFYKDVCGA